MNTQIIKNCFLHIILEILHPRQFDELILFLIRKLRQIDDIILIYDEKMQTYEIKTNNQLLQEYIVLNILKYWVLRFFVCKKIENLNEMKKKKQRMKLRKILLKDCDDERQWLMFEQIEDLNHLIIILHNLRCMILLEVSYWLESKCLDIHILLCKNMLLQFK